MDTRPKHEQLIEIARDVLTLKRSQVDRPCPRQRFFVEARKRDNGDVLRSLSLGTSSSAFGLRLENSRRRSRSDRLRRKPPESSTNNAG
jgi:hypothetical protein